MILLIAEKPSVALGPYKELLEKIEGERFSKKDGYLEGQRYIISWCVGHLVGLSMPEEYGWGWDLESLPMIPEKWKLKVLPSTKRQFQILSKLCESAKTIIHGADAGREGELITNQALSLMNVSEKTQLRLWVNSFDLPSLSKAWKKMEPIQNYKPLLASAMARSRADWLVGLNGTVAYSVKTGQRGLSVGRVQTPTLALIVNRDKEIQNWKEKYFYQVKANWGNFDFTWFDENGSDINDEFKANNIKEKIENREGVLQDLQKTEKSINPGKPFDLTELQKEANNKFGFKAADTLKITQALYEAKFVSYPRTDSQYLPESMKGEVIEIVKILIKPEEKEYMRKPSENFLFFNSKKVTDHYAIIPTGLVPQKLSEKENQIFQLIRNQFIRAFMKPYRYEEYKLQIAVNSEKMRTTLSYVMDYGFKGLLKGEGEKDTSSNILGEPLPSYELGHQEDVVNPRVEKKKATKPNHYTEASLLAAMNTAGRVIDNEDLREAMKERGLGTPATKAAIIERLKKVGYIEASGKKLKATPKGTALIDMVDENLKSPEMTGNWEYNLNQMAKRNYTPSAFKDEIVGYVKSLIENIKNQDLSNFNEKITEDNLSCPKCKQQKLIQSPKIWKCPGEACGFILWPRMAGKKLTVRNLSDLIIKGKTAKIKGFKTKGGKGFEAVVKLNENWEAKLEF